jgi:hypothetical protein
MIRHLAYLAPLALLGLAACNGPAALTKAKEGDCFTVTGKEASGAPKLEKTECLTSATAADVTVPVEPATPEMAAATGATAVPGACPTVPAVCPPAATAPAPTAARAERRSSRRVAASRSSSRSSSRTERNVMQEERDYARVYTPDYPQPELLGAPPPHRGQRHSREESHEYSYAPPAPYLPPAPPPHRYEQQDEAYDQGYQGRRKGPPPQAYLPPPPPPPAYAEGGRHGRKDHAQGGSRYGRSESYSSQEYERRSYSSSSSSSSSSYSRGGYGCPERCDERGVMAPMNGPHFPIDADGFLTWRGKTR